MVTLVDNSSLFGFLLAYVALTAFFKGFCMVSFIIADLLGLFALARWATATGPVSVAMVSKNGHDIPFPVFSASWVSEEEFSDDCTEDSGEAASEQLNPNPNGPLIPCEFLDDRWVECKDPVDAMHGPNRTKLLGTCLKFGGSRYEQVERTKVSCRVLPCIECRGTRTFYREVSCIKYTGHYFLSTVLYSMFLGFLAVDRFCLGYSAIAVGKLMTIGGLGVWWLVDLFLLLSGRLMPADGSNWQPYF